MIKDNQVLLFEDTVCEGIYHYFIKKDTMYYMHMDIQGEVISKVLSEDFKESEQTFHYFNMLFCAFYDTHGLDSYKEAITYYIDATVKPIEEGDSIWI